MGSIAMITRDNKASISGTAQSARQRFGEVLKHYRKERDLTVREVARRCKVPIGTVEKWEEGEQLPNSDEWKALCRGIAHALMKFDDLYKRARDEAAEEARTRAQTNIVKEQTTVQSTRPNNPSVKIGTSIGDKLAEAVREAAAAPEPVKEQPKLEIVPIDRAKASGARKAMPPGSKTADSIDRRKAFVRDLLIARPRIRTQGADSVVEAVRKAFGVGISPETVDSMRDDIRKEQIKAEIMKELPPPTPPTLPAMAAQIVEHVTQAAPIIPSTTQTRDAEQELRAAVSLVLDAIPNLQTFTITVDEHGEAHVDYSIRKVVVTTEGGSLKVKR